MMAYSHLQPQNSDQVQLDVSGMHKIASITIGEAVWHKDSMVQGHWEYEVKSQFNGTNNEYQVKRRYTEMVAFQHSL